MSDSCKVPQVKPIVIKRFGTSGLIPTIPTTTDCNLWQKTDLKDGEFAVNTQDNKLYIRSGNQILELTSGGGGGSGSVTSVGLSMPAAFSVANSPITSSGTLIVTATGTTGEYIRGDGSLATFPTIPNAQVNSDWNATTGVAEILNKPNLNLATWTLDFTAGTLTVDLYAPFNLSIDVVTNIVNAPTTTILVNAGAYVLGDPILQGDEITVTVNIAGVINLEVEYA